MSVNNLKDISLQLDDNSMFNIIGYKQNTLHPILQAAVTIIFFTNNEEFRSEYNGLYHLVGQANNNILNDLDLDLAHMSFAVLDALKETYPEVLKVEFIPEIEGNKLVISINITTTDDYLTTIIYNKEL